MQNLAPNVSAETISLAYLLRDCGFSYESMTDKSSETLRRALPDGCEFKDKEVFKRLSWELYQYATYRSIKEYDDNQYL